MLGPASHGGWQEAGRRQAAQTDKRLEKEHLPGHVLEKMGLVRKDL